MMWNLWWIWLAAGVVLAILEVLIPGFILLGFAIGAAVVGILFAIGGPIGAWLSGSLPLTLLVFAVVSLIAWIILRRVVGVQKNQTKIWEQDINDT